MSYIIVGTVIFSGLVTAGSHIKAGNEQEQQLEQQADQEKLAAESQELQRRQQLNKVLAQNIVSQAMGGISTEGTPASIAMQTAKNVSVSEGIESVSQRMRAAALKSAGRSARKVANMQGAATFIGSLGQAASLGGNNATKS